jgi:hypothetical protein
VRLRLRPEVHIVGADTDEARRMMKPLQMRLLGGKRELLHAGSRAIPKEIRGTKIEEDEKGVGGRARGCRKPCLYRKMQVSPQAPAVTPMSHLVIDREPCS